MSHTDILYEQQIVVIWT